MDKKNDGQELRPYFESFEHISDICRVIRLCFEPDHSENTDDLASELDRLRSREDMTSDTDLPLVVVRERFMLSGFEYFCIMLGISSALEGNGAAPTFSEAISHYPFIESENVYLTMLAEKPFQYLLDMEEGCGIERRFKLKSFIFNFIIGNDVSIPNITFNVYPGKFPLLYGDLYGYGVDFISANELSCLVINGKTGSGRRTLAAQICGSFGNNTAVVYAEDIKDIEELADILTGACVLTESVPVVIADEEVKKAVSLVNALTALLPTVFVCTDSEDSPIRPHSRSCLSLKTAPLDNSLRLKAWEYYLDGTDIDVKFLSERYRLTVGDIAEVCKRCSPRPADIKELMNGILSLNSESLICKLIHPMFCLEDLVAQDHITEALKRIIRTVESLPRLMEQHGFDKLFPYGRGMGVLFYGASGTGKTMSAYILAAELGLEVMRVDLSRIEDKYIGETEKRISEVFQKAEENNCLLFFDEADSLFAKRTEVMDAHDRHANSQTAHLLQKMEEYGGIVVLATNIEGNIDPAFKRRLHFTLEFLKPDTAARAELWRRFIPETLPREDIDFDFLASAFDLSPAEIKWAALSAAVCAEGSPLSMRHIMSALKYEYEKFGLSFPNIGYKKINLGGDTV
ncbi:MAG: ATP-binding protein [Oscillospiraceae bacterium]|nr:ATP-binding protein [Oscillospiraceae bacterium]